MSNGYVLAEICSRDCKGVGLRYANQHHAEREGSPLLRVGTTKYHTGTGKLGGAAAVYIVCVMCVVNMLVAAVG